MQAVVSMDPGWAVGLVQLSAKASSLHECKTSHRIMLERLAMLKQAPLTDRGVLSSMTSSIGSSFSVRLSKARCSRSILVAEICIAAAFAEADDIAAATLCGRNACWHLTVLRRRNAVMYRATSYGSLILLTVFTIVEHGVRVVDEYI
jgi:hypothetical protein